MPTTVNTKYDRIIQGQRHHIERFETVKSKFLQKVQDNPNFALHWNATEMMLAQARYEVATNLVTAVDEGRPVEEVIEWFCQDYEQRLDYMISVGNGSTSAMANLVEEAEKQARTEVYSEIKKAERFS